MSKSASFDILGTCFGFESAISKIEERLGPALRSVGADSKPVFWGWFFGAQRDFTYCSLAQSYKPIAQILRHTFRRACMVNDLPSEDISDEDVDEIMKVMVRLEARPGLKKCIDGLRARGWEVHGVTNGGKETSLKYFELADIELKPERLLSCDEVQVAKPDLRVYQNSKKIQQEVGAWRGENWFVAAHAWDLLAAKQVGYKTAYLDYEEHDACTPVFGEFDIYATSMEDLLEQLAKLP